MLDTISLVILFLLVVFIIWAVLMLGPLPGKIAASREHPQKDAINICGWIGIFTGGVFWLVAIVWAYMRPAKVKIAALEERLQAIEDKLKKGN